MISIDKHSPIPIYKQIIFQIKKEIILGRLKEGDKLPTVRELALKMKVNVNTVLKAYERLVIEGVIESVQGKGYFVKGERKLDERMVRDLEKVVREMKGNGLELGLVMVLIQEVWNRGEI